MPAAVGSEPTGPMSTRPSWLFLLVERWTERDRVGQILASEGKVYFSYKLSINEQVFVCNSRMLMCVCVCVCILNLDLNQESFSGVPKGLAVVLSVYVSSLIHSFRDSVVQGQGQGLWRGPRYKFKSCLCPLSCLGVTLGQLITS